MKMIPICFLDEVPPEILDYIFYYCTKKDLKNLVQCCKRFHKALIHKLYRNISISRSELSDGSLIEERQESLPFVQSLHCSKTYSHMFYFPDTITHNYQVLLKLCTDLQSLSLEGTKKSFHIKAPGDHLQYVGDGVRIRIRPNDRNVDAVQRLENLLRRFRGEMDNIDENGDSSDDDNGGHDSNDDSDENDEDNDVEQYVDSNDENNDDNGDDSNDENNDNNGDDSDDENNDDNGGNSNDENNDDDNENGDNSDVDVEEGNHGPVDPNEIMNEILDHIDQRLDGLDNIIAAYDNIENEGIGNGNNENNQDDNAEDNDEINDNENEIINDNNDADNEEEDNDNDNEEEDNDNDNEGDNENHDEIDVEDDEEEEIQNRDNEEIQDEDNEEIEEDDEEIEDDETQDDNEGIEENEEEIEDDENQDDNDEIEEDEEVQNDENEDIDSDEENAEVMEDDDPEDNGANNENEINNDEEDERIGENESDKEDVIRDLTIPSGTDFVSDNIMIYKSLQICSNLVSIHFSYLENISRSSLDHLPFLSHLRELKFTYSDITTDILQCVGKCTQIEILIFENSARIDLPCCEIISRLTQLKKFILSKAKRRPRISNQHLINLKNLTTLELNSCIIRNDINDLFTSSIVLNELSLYDSEIYNDSLRRLDSQEQLTKLDLSYSFITNTSFEIIGRLKLLQILILSHNGCYKDAGIDNLRGLKNLKKLHLDHNGAITDRIFEVLRDLPIVDLNLSFNSKLFRGNDYVDLILMTKLKSLDISDINNVNDMCLIFLSDMRLEKLIVSSRKITDSAISDFCKKTGLKTKDNSSRSCSHEKITFTT